MSEYSMQKNNINKRTEHLIFGFVRNVKIVKQIIPSAIILLCIKFYQIKRLRMICALRGDVFSVHVADLKTDNYYKGILRNTSNINKHSIGRMIGLCFTQNFKFIPENILTSNNLHNKYNYDVLFHINKRACAGYIVDSMPNDIKKEINLYHWQLPPLPDKILDNSGESVVLYSSNNGLIQIGFSNKTFNVLKFNTNLMKWQKGDDINRPRRWFAANIINDDNLIIVGGQSVNVNGKHVDMYNFNTKQWTSLSNLLNRRSKSGIYSCDKSGSTKVYVIGGWPSETKVECCDIQKNKWIQLCDTNRLQNQYPVVWMDDNINIINVGSTAANGIFERMDLRENKWEIICSNPIQSKFGYVSHYGTPSIRYRFCL